MEQLLSSFSSGVLMVVKPTTLTQPTISGLMQSIVADAATMTTILFSRGVRAFPCLAQVPLIDRIASVHGRNQTPLVAMFQNQETRSLYEILYSITFKSLAVPATYTALIALSLLICRFGLMVYKWATRRTTVIFIPSPGTSTFISAEFSITLPSTSKSLKDHDDQEKLKELVYKSIQQVLSGLNAEAAEFIPCRKDTLPVEAPSAFIVDESSTSGNDDEHLPVYAPDATTPIDEHRIEVTFPQCASDVSQSSDLTQESMPRTFRRQRTMSAPAAIPDSDDDEKFIYPGSELDESASSEAANDSLESWASDIDLYQPFVMDPNTDWTTTSSEMVDVPSQQSSSIHDCDTAADVPSSILYTQPAVAASAETIVVALTPISKSDRPCAPNLALVEDELSPVPHTQLKKRVRCNRRGGQRKNPNDATAPPSNASNSSKAVIAAPTPSLISTLDTYFEEQQRKPGGGLQDSMWA